MSNIWTEKGVQKWLDDAGYDAKVLGIIRYKVGKQLRTDIEVTCVECEEPFRRNWYNYRREGEGRCPTCVQKRREQTLRNVFYSRNNLLDLCPQIADIWDQENEHPPEYYGLNSNERAKFICNKCGSRRTTHIVTVANSILNGGSGCLRCDKHYSRTEEEFVEELAVANPTIELMGGYKGTGTQCFFSL